jgi:hypothetical protein
VYRCERIDTSNSSPGICIFCGANPWPNLQLADELTLFSQKKHIHFAAAARLFKIAHRKNLHKLLKFSHFFCCDNSLAVRFGMKNFLGAAWETSFCQFYGFWRQICLNAVWTFLRAAPFPIHNASAALCGKCITSSGFTYIARNKFVHSEGRHSIENHSGASNFLESVSFLILA